MAKRKKTAKEKLEEAFANYNSTPSVPSTSVNNATYTYDGFGNVISNIVYTPTTSSTSYTIGPSNSYTISTPSNYTISNASINISTTTKYSCSGCKKDFEEDIFIRTTDATTMHYKGPQFERHICKDCYCKAMDKLFGIDNAAEFTLYE